MTMRKLKSSRRLTPKTRRGFQITLLIVFMVALAGIVINENLSHASSEIADKSSSATESASSRWDYIMTDLIGLTRHFKGSPEAPVTILEFSDFQ